MVELGERTLRSRYGQAEADAKALGIKPSWPPPYGSGNASCKNSSADVLDYLIPTPPCWQCYLEERSAYPREKDPLNERLDHQVVICVAYYRDGRRKEIIFDWWGGIQTPEEFRKRYPYLDRIIENKYWTRCSDGNPEMVPPPHTPWQSCQAQG
jgi:hypothetical protein